MSIQRGSFWLAVVGVAVLCAGLTTNLTAQTVTASLYGAVNDPAGASVPAAQVTVTDVATGISTKSTSDANGDYRFPRLAPATYSLTVEKDGFKSTVISGVQLLVDQSARLDVKLEVGSVSTRVEVLGTAPLVDSSTASIGTVIGQRDVVDLPLNGRRFGSLAILVPGTTTDNGGFASSAIGSPFSEVTYAANGARTSSNSPVIDGVESRNMGFGGFALQPPPDAIQEFKIQTNIYDAAFGKTAGSTINLVTKSGSNQFHGSAYEFLRNDVFDATNYFANSKPEFRRNQFGAALGGPIRKNKTFFFVNYESLRQIKGATLSALVPTPQQLSGDFSNILTGNIVNVCGAGGPANLNFDSGQLFDPATESLQTCSSGDLAGQTVLVGDPIPGNIITNINPVAAKIISLGAFPAPNTPDTLNFVNQDPETRFDHQWDVRIDNNFGDKDKLFGRYLFGQSKIAANTGYTVLPGFGDLIYYRGQNVALGWTHTFGPELLNEATFGFQRNYNIQNCAECPRADGFTADFGIQNLQGIRPDLEAFPYFGLVNFAGVGDANYRPVVSPDMVEKYQDVITWTHGKHTVVAGVDFQPYQILSKQAPFSPHGQIYFSGQYSSLASELDGGAATAGVADLADFLLGYPFNAAKTIRLYPVNQVGGSFLNVFGQDNIKVTQNFSVNLGLRWEYRRPSVDKNNNYVTLVPTGPEFSGPGNALLVTAADDDLNDSFCTDPAYSYLSSSDGRCLVATSAERRELGFTGRTRRTLLFGEKTNFAPRIGISWRPTSSDKFVIHSGYGIFYDLANFNNQTFVGNNPVFSPSQIFSTNFGTPPIASTETVFAGSGGIPTLVDQFSSLYLSSDYKTPYIQQWSFGIQSQLASDWAVEVNYVGAKGSRLSDLHLFGNQAAPGTTDLQSRRPYVDFGPTLYTSSNGRSNYNSLQSKLTKRFTHGLSLLTSYTFAHSNNTAEGDEGFGGGSGNVAQNDNDLEGEYGRSYTDARHRLVISYVWELPFGKGQMFLNQGGVLNQILGGWEVSGVTSLQSGFPFTIRASDFSNTGARARPDRTCSGDGPKTQTQWFDTSCFTTEQLQLDRLAGNPRFGNSGRNILDGPGNVNFDLALLKRFSASERFKFEFRAEFFNAFNTPHFGQPGIRLESPDFGQINSAAEPRDIQFGLKLIY
jgi:hypothetical protein